MSLCSLMCFLFSPSLSLSLSLSLSPCSSRLVHVYVVGVEPNGSAVGVVRRCDRIVAINDYNVEVMNEKKENSSNKNSVCACLEILGSFSFPSPSHVKGKTHKKVLRLLRFAIMETLTICLTIAREESAQVVILFHAS